MEWMRSRDIESPEVLTDLLGKVADAVRQGDLIQYYPEDLPMGLVCDITAIKPNGPWPDHMQMYFKDEHTGHRYRLFAETYHGSGGRWGIVT